MGSSPSTLGRLDVPLYAQPNSFLATDNGVVAEVTTSFRIKPGNRLDKIEVFDALNDEFMFRFKSHSFSSRYSLQTPSERILMSTKVPSFSASRRVYDGDQTEKESFLIRAKSHMSTPSVIFAEFHDRLSGDACRVIVEGIPTDEVVLVYLERGPGALPPIDKRDDRSSSRFQPIARIHQRHKGSFYKYEYFVDVAPGVDTTLVLLLWHFRFTIEYGWHNSG